MRYLLDCEGAVETARQHTETGHFDDRRIDQVMRELERYRITVAALQETKWFGEAVYKVGESIVLAAGRPTPPVGEPRQRGEGVVITLSGPAVKAWKAGGEQWKAWSSRLVTATLQPGRANSDRIHILSCYAPTFAASRADKNKFLDELQQALDAIPPSECYVIMGDFNARVGSRVSVNDQWANVRGLGEINDAGCELLTFLSINEETVCNTWFPKWTIHKHTWQHPKSKRWHCIDFAIARQRDQKRCLDACVKRGAECNTNHQLLRIKIRVKGKGGCCQLKNKISKKKFTVSRFMSRGGANSGADMYRDAYRECVGTKAVEVWEDEGTVEEKWSAIRSALVEAGKEVLGQEGQQHPDWFRESSEILEPLFQMRNLLYTKWLSSGRAVDH